MSLVVPIFALACLGADEAILLGGSRLTGNLEETDGQIQFATSKKQYPLDQLHRVRFGDAPGSCPRGPLRHRLVLGEDFLSGELAELDAQSVRFHTCLGTTIQVARSRFQGIAQPAGWRVVHQEDFGDKKGLTLSKQFVWPLPLGGFRGRVCFFLQREEKAAPLDFDVVVQSGMQTRSFRTQCAGKAGRYVVQIDVQADRCRVSVDDAVLTDEAGKEMKLVRLVFHADPAATWALAQLTCLTETPLVALPAPLAGVDTMCLTKGDEIFGTIVHADARSVTLRAKFGQRMFPWSDLRGIVFPPQGANKAAAPKHILDVVPAPGFIADRVSGHLQSLSDERVVIRHEVFGELIFPRSACRQLIVVPTKK